MFGNILKEIISSLREKYQQRRLKILKSLAISNIAIFNIGDSGGVEILRAKIIKYLIVNKSRRKVTKFFASALNDGLFESPILKEKVQSEAGQLLGNCLIFGQNVTLKAKQPSCL